MEHGQQPEQEVHQDHPGTALSILGQQEDSRSSLSLGQWEEHLEAVSAVLLQTPDPPKISVIYDMTGKPRCNSFPDLHI